MKVAYFHYRSPKGVPPSTLSAEEMKEILAALSLLGVRIEEISGVQFFTDALLDIREALIAADSGEIACFVVPALPPMWLVAHLQDATRTTADGTEVSIPVINPAEPKCDLAISYVPVRVKLEYLPLVQGTQIE